VDISETFDLKLKALRCHKSQIDPMGIPDLGKWLRKRCRIMAEGSEFELAEAFHQVKAPH